MEKKNATEGNARLGWLLLNQKIPSGLSWFLSELPRDTIFSINTPHPHLIG